MCEPRIYVVDLAAYNNGKLHGVWIDAALELDDIQEAVAKMLKASPEGFAEEYAIHDYEGFGSYRVSEYEGLESVHEVACFIEEHDELGAELLAHFSSIDEARTAIEENYSGCYESVADFAEELTEDSVQIPESLARYIDYNAMAYDMEVSGDIFTIELGHREVHIFWSR
ncbi:antirestriction protein ArdA [Halioxenophilus sp. WMMB6]|uniref:antirestriction protein ArdA n=1 Tax=Halioxenophilus sp. WMMB6 TaxID=3073815 RepID=UPI00295E28AB|nr:antirestriction protein ArdA [Halioxenophilus sp. WMMB6]